MSRIRPAALEERLAAASTTDSADAVDGPFVLDIRPASAYGDDAIEGSVNLPVYDELRSGDESGLRDGLDELPADREVVVVCKMGIVAKLATDVLVEEGYDAVTLLGGMHGWRGYKNGTLGYRLRSLVWRLS